MPFFYHCRRGFSLSTFKHTGYQELSIDSNYPNQIKILQQTNANLCIRKPAEILHLETERTEEGGIFSPSRHACADVGGAAPGSSRRTDSK